MNPVEKTNVKIEIEYLCWLFGLHIFPEFHVDFVTYPVVLNLF